MATVQLGGWVMCTVQGAVIGGLAMTAHAQTAPNEPLAPPKPARAIPAHDDDTPPMPPRPSALAAAAPGLTLEPPTESSPLDKAPMWRDRPVSVLLRVGVDIGGDEIFSGTTSDGSSVSMSGGGGGVISGGLLIAPDAPYAFEVTLGYKTTNQSFSNGSISFSRIPLDAILSFAPGNHRLGIGMTAHFAPTFDCNVSGICAGRVELDTSYGLLLQWAYTLHHVELGLRATVIGYHATEIITGATASFSGNSAGAFVDLRL